MTKEIIALLQRLIAIQEALLVIHQPLDREELLDSADVKQLLNISSSTLYRLSKNGLIRSKQLGGKRYYLKSSIYQKVLSK